MLVRDLTASKACNNTKNAQLSTGIEAGQCYLRCNFEVHKYTVSVPDGKTAVDEYMSARNRNRRQAEQAHLPMLPPEPEVSVVAG